MPCGYLLHLKPSVRIMCKAWADLGLGVEFKLKNLTLKLKFFGFKFYTEILVSLNPKIGIYGCILTHKITFRYTLLSARLWYSVRQISALNENKKKFF